MFSIVPASSIIQRVKEQLEAEDGVFYSDDDYIEAYNDALDEIADETEFFESHVVVQRRKWALYTDLRGVLPSTALRVVAVWNLNTAKWMFPTTPKELDLTVGRGWERNTDLSRWWFMRGLWHLAAYPVPGDDMSPLRVYYSSLFPHIKSDGGLIAGLSSKAPIPPDFDCAIEYYMTSSLLAERGEAEKSLAKWNEFQTLMSQLKTLSDWRVKHDRTPNMGARRNTTRGVRR